MEMSNGDLVPVPPSSPTKLIDHLIGTKPVREDFVSLEARVESFDKDTWRQQGISVFDSPLLSPTSFANAGFYYTGQQDCVYCFWCGLSLRLWARHDVPKTRHLRSNPRCTWMLRVLGRELVRKLYSSESDEPFDRNADIDYGFIRGVEPLSGTLDIIISSQFFIFIRVYLY